MCDVVSNVDQRVRAEVGRGEIDHLVLYARMPVGQQQHQRVGSFTVRKDRS